jgi:ubiquitin C-terminal hydrolase
MNLQDVQPNPFPNTGNICYFNATLQCILAAKPFTFTKEIKYPPNISIFRNMLKHLNKNNKPVFDTSEQQCAGELYTTFMDAYENYPQFVDSFKFDVVDVLICGRCENETKTTERSNILIIENIYNTEVDRIMFETTVDRNCSKCHFNKSVKKTFITNVAAIIVFQVKRGSEKNIIKFPDDIKINNKVYNAIGFVHHVGTSDGGHYTANVKYKEWWVADDKNVSKERLRQESINMAFYKIEEN